MEPKPLSKEKREYLWRSLDGPQQPAMTITLGEILAAEQFWREAVKNADIHDCCFCGADGVYLKARAEAHKPDCPWLLARESD